MGETPSQPEGPGGKPNPKKPKPGVIWPDFDNLPDGLTKAPAPEPKFDEVDDLEN